LEEEPSFFFEKQNNFSLQCGVHSLNNLIGYRYFSEKSLNDICFALSADLINPHKHILGGDFDANGMIIAL
jgi:hypothetical protein